MSLRLREITLNLHEDESSLTPRTALELGLQPEAIRNLRIVRRGIDARRKPRVLRVYTVEFEVKDEAALLERCRENRRLELVRPLSEPRSLPIGSAHRSLVVGMGPAGLFAALHLARCGSEVILVEQGAPVEERVHDVRSFWDAGELDPGSNVQFGEGGAGTFSDGKLTTRLNHPWTSLVLKTLVAFGAPEEILLQAKPHVGTDRLRLVLIRFRKALQDLGVTLRFRCRLTDIMRQEGRVVGGILDDGEECPADSLLLAPGHSARGTYRMLADRGVQLAAKPFAVGLRVEHPAEWINEIQYGFPRHPSLPTADYALTWNNAKTGRGVYSFCMCPGGEVVNASSELGGLVVNGMSSRRRDGSHSNSALVVSVRPEDFRGEDPLAGVRFQRALEKSAFTAGGGDYFAPAQNLLRFLRQGDGPLTSTCRPGVREADLREVLPPFAVQELLEALPMFERRMRGFITAEACLTGVETRTSAPLRIVRGEDGQSLSHPGLYPAGEGAGYAGGIMSAALDGLRAAEHIAERYRSSR